MEAEQVDDELALRWYDYRGYTASIYQDKDGCLRADIILPGGYAEVQAFEVEPLLEEVRKVVDEDIAEAAEEDDKE